MTLGFDRTCECLTHDIINAPEEPDMSDALSLKSLYCSHIFVMPS